ncbi:hypothetical protein OIDMADRAFT_179013 [Oidiodendron maius Zn]|uniref:Carbohydrate-binding module family 50 protein n=1 Tax=Oidiodendron maius (strain Zn) TaxID=913774 RepID=A0A0C3HH84_OIDMZ|nr:hypothetical protein OIDMADRAFT_179013 [Oidiodendron maius Zn]
MFALRILLAAGSFTLINGAPVSPLSDLVKRAPTSSHSLESRNPSTYVQIFSGDGATSQGWPSMDQWVPSFDDMFNANLDILADSCSQFGVANNQDSENESMRTAIKNVGASTGVDPRFILAIVMQESNGCVRAPTTNYGVENPGLMQSHNGAGTCNSGSNVQNPCPIAEITSMIQDGTNGTPDGPGLKQLIAQAGTSDDSKYYIAARMYNSGSVAAGGNLGAGIATHCYATDVANRLVGWSSGPTSCNSNTIGSLTGIDTLFSGRVYSNDDSTPAPSSAAVAPASSTTTTSVATPTQTPGGVFIESPSPVAPTPVASTSTISVASPVNTGKTIADVAPPAPAAPVTGTGTAIAAGTACSSEGEWNCINATSFQQCGSGVWSPVQALAAGTECKSGQSATIQITEASSKKRHLSHLSQAHHLLKHARHVSF